MNPEQCDQDHEQLLRDMDQLCSADLGRLARPLMQAALSGDGTPRTHEALELIGRVLSGRKQAA